MNGREYIVLILLCAVVSFHSTAQSVEPDSLKFQELNEVVVEASNQRTSSNVFTYIPMIRQKNAASDEVVSKFKNRRGMPLTCLYKTLIIKNTSQSDVPTISWIPNFDTASFHRSVKRLQI